MKEVVSIELPEQWTGAVPPSWTKDFQTKFEVITTTTPEEAPMETEYDLEFHLTHRWLTSFGLGPQRLMRVSSDCTRQNI
jgi:hypothetical protein